MLAPDALTDEQLANARGYFERCYDSNTSNGWASVVLGRGDTWEDAFAMADRDAARSVDRAGKEGS